MPWHADYQTHVLIRSTAKEMGIGRPTLLRFGNGTTKLPESFQTCPRGQGLAGFLLTNSDRLFLIVSVTTGLNPCLHSKHSSLLERFEVAGSYRHTWMRKPVSWFVAWLKNGKVKCCTATLTRSWFHDVPEEYLPLLLPKRLPGCIRVTSDEHFQLYVEL